MQLSQASNVTYILETALIVVVVLPNNAAAARRAVIRRVATAAAVVMQLLRKTLRQAASFVLFKYRQYLMHFASSTCLQSKLTYPLDGRKCHEVALMHET